ncbi:hypothetical protein F9551_21115 [Escherichia coli]|nr:hypothetical protein [Escherichia coli]EFH4666199.1 hypothetical protein [Escherichia coli]HAZ3655260.1 hypothetical protein [Escherichia coli]
MIGTSRQDGFMHYRNVVCLLSCSLFLSSAWGCRLDEPERSSRRANFEALTPCRYTAAIT